MCLVERVIRIFDKLNHNIESELHFVKKEDLNVEVRFYEYNRRTKQKNYLRSVNVIALEENYLADFKGHEFRYNQ